jgi:hypothetical protein
VLSFRRQWRVRRQIARYADGVTAKPEDFLATCLDGSEKIRRIFGDGQRTGGQGMQRHVELRVRDGGEDILVYTFESAAGAARMIHYLSDFFPDAEFLLQPLLH